MNININIGIILLIVGFISIVIWIFNMNKYDAAVIPQTIIPFFLLWIFVLAGIIVLMTTNSSLTLCHITTEKELKLQQENKAKNIRQKYFNLTSQESNLNEDEEDCISKTNGQDHQI